MNTIILALDINSAIFTCINCNKPLQQAIFDSTFYPNLFIMLLAFLVLGILVILLSYQATKTEKKHQHYDSKLTIVPLVSTAMVLGIGLGGFIDGIVLHQILQWHEMLSNKLPPVSLINKSVNMFWDGIFHAFTLAVTGVGIFLMFKLFYRTDVIINGKSFIGGLLMGWGLFNIIEGVIDHHILKLHNVREVTNDVLFWNYGFLLSSVVLIGVSLILIRAGLQKHHNKAVH